MLVVFCGLSGVGKTAISRPVADSLGATWIRIDSIETALARVGLPVEDSPAAYVVGNALAADQLRAGRDVVVDAVNPVRAARTGWAELAAATGTVIRFVDVRCSDVAEHRRRVEARRPDIAGHVLPTWAQLQAYECLPWDQPHLEVDNLGDIAQHVATVLGYVRSG